ncbi:unnamed protein product [Schistosoma mattheei]|uniref:Uncharacterized protein n=1 Tax=Schistosoma mattheei TaxID=31246 RepID=A0A183NYR5_9TREM|nr:unnamed protein product [Schistosoma mattheei]
MDNLSNFPNMVMKSSVSFVKIVLWIVSMKSESRKDEFISHLNYTRNIESMVLKLPMQECLKGQADLANTRYILLVSLGNINDDKHADVVKGKFNSHPETARISYGSSSNDNIPSHDGCAYRGSSSLMCSENHCLNQCQKSNNKDVKERREFVPRHELGDFGLMENHIAKYRGLPRARSPERCG